MGSKKSETIIPLDSITRKIYVIRGKKVMLDQDLAALFKVKLITLRQQVKRNLERFPEDFMFQLNSEESRALVSQNVKPGMQEFGGYMPYVFTVLGMVMLSSVLKSEEAIQVSIQIMRTRGILGPNFN